MVTEEIKLLGLKGDFIVLNTQELGGKPGNIYRKERG